MKKLIITAYLSIMSVSCIFSQSDTLINNYWKLLYLIEKDSGNLKINADDDYWIYFGDDLLQSTLTVNTCRYDYTFINTDSLDIYNGGCTKICCDGGIFKRLNYNDTFHFYISTDTLFLSSEKKLYVFSKESNFPSIKCNGPKNELFEIFPNPSGLELSIRISDQVDVSGCKINILNNTGNVIWEIIPYQHDFILSLNVLKVKGPYLIQLIKNGQILDNMLFLYE